MTPAIDTVNTSQSVSGAEAAVMRDHAAKRPASDLRSQMCVPHANSQLVLARRYAAVHHGNADVFVMHSLYAACETAAGHTSSWSIRTFQGKTPSKPIDQEVSTDLGYALRVSGQHAGVNCAAPH
jgi:hypothetical protein